MMGIFPTVTLHNGKEQALLRRHPWVFSGAIRKTSPGIQAGDVVAVTSAQGQILGYGFFEDGSLAVKIFSFGETTINELFWQEKIAKALRLRKSIGLTNHPATNAYRIVNAEGDQLPGLVADYYNGVVVLQAQSRGTEALLGIFTKALERILGDRLKAVYCKPPAYAGRDARTRELPGGFLSGESAAVTISENDCLFEVDFVEGQKTGFFLDQRENRLLLRQYAKGRKVLNTYSYTGGFTINALKGGARSVHSVDTSRRAIDGCNRNVALNGFDSSVHEASAIDAIEFLNQMQPLYDLIVLDPPAFAKHNDQRRNAIQAYRHINRQASAGIHPGGILFTFSCSQVLSHDMFQSVVLSAAIEAGRDVSILHHLSQPPDHPVSLFHPEGEYLKGLVLHVE